MMLISSMPGKNQTLTKTANRVSIAFCNPVNLGLFSPAALQEAEKIILGESAVFHFDLNGKLTQRRATDEVPFDLQKLADSEGFSPSLLDMMDVEESEIKDFRADYTKEQANFAICAIALALYHLSELDSRPLEDLVSVEVTSRNSLFDHVFGLGRSLDLGPMPSLETDANIEAERKEKQINYLMEDLQTNLEQTESLLRQDPDADTNRERFKSCLLAGGETLKYLDADRLIRFHNIFPDAVNFALAKDNQFLLQNCGVTETVVQPVAFINSVWRHLTGRITAIFDPGDLEKIRAAIKAQNTNPHASPVHLHAAQHRPG